MTILRAFWLICAPKYEKQRQDPETDATPLYCTATSRSLTPLAPTEYLEPPRYLYPGFRCSKSKNPESEERKGTHTSIPFFACALEGLVEGVVLAYPELHRAGPVEHVVCLEVLDDVPQQVGSLDLDTDRVVHPGRRGNTRGKP